MPCRFRVFERFAEIRSHRSRMLSTAGNFDRGSQCFGANIHYTLHDYKSRNSNVQHNKRFFLISDFFSLRVIKWWKYWYVIRETI